MRDSRIGEQLWHEWPLDDCSYATIDHVDLDNEIVRKALASSLQRDGIAESLGEAFKMLDGAEISHCHAGYVDGADEMTLCDESGMTHHGDTVELVHPLTLVSLNGC